MESYIEHLEHSTTNPSEGIRNLGPQGIKDISAVDGLFVAVMIVALFAFLRSQTRRFGPLNLFGGE